eukprot:3424689-Prymnesium_polylepis.1
MRCCRAVCAVAWHAHAHGEHSPHGRTCAASWAGERVEEGRRAQGCGSHGTSARSQPRAHLVGEVRRAPRVVDARELELVPAELLVRQLLLLHELLLLCLQSSLLLLERHDALRLAHGSTVRRQRVL